MTNRHNPSTPALIHPASASHVVVLVSSVATLSYLAARIGGRLMMRPEMIWPLWPGCAFLTAVLLLTPRKIWPAVLLAGIAGFAVYDIQEALPIRATVSLLVADCIEILVAALGVSYVFGGVPRLNSVKALVKYAFFAVILAPVSVASAAASALEGDSWWVGFFTEALALLTLTPAILGCVDVVVAGVKKPLAHYIEAASLWIGLAILAYFTFAASGSQSRPAMLYSLVPFLLWAALRFGITGASSSIVLVAFLATLGVIHRRGPFTSGMPIRDVLSLQLFLLVAGSSFMVLAAVVEEHKAAEQSVRESENRLRLAQQVARIGAFERDVATGTNTWTPQMEALYGLPSGSFGNTRTAFENLVHPDDKAEVVKFVNQALETGQPTTGEWRVIWPDGSLHWIAGRWQTLLNDSGEPARVVGVNMDITDRKQMEEALSEINRKLIQSQEQERTRIGRELHDDINQRLAMLALELQQLQEDPSEVSTRLQELRQQTVEISNDVQGLSHELHSSKLEYLGVVAGIRSWCNEFGERQGMEITFTIHVPNPIPLEIGLTLFRILQEGLHNAVKHSGVKHIEVELSERSNDIQLTIADLGKGFDVEAARQGRGLGLASMEERARLVKGTITFESRPMRGTVIRVSVPLTREWRPQSAAG